MSHVLGRMTGTPLRAATAWTALAVGVTLVGALVVELVAPDSDPLLRRLPVVLVLLALALLVGRRVGWRALSAGGPSTWHDLRLLVVPLLVVMVPLAWGWAPDPGTLALLVVGYAATGAFEELWYRGVVLRSALPLGPVRGATVSAVLFGAAHLSNIAFGASPAVTAAQAVGSAAGGFGYAVLRQRTDALWLLAALHGLGDLLLHTTGMHGAAMWAVLVGHDVALFAWGLVCLRGLRRGPGARAHSSAVRPVAEDHGVPRSLRRSTVVACAVYVGAWLLGLGVAGGSVDRALDDDGVRSALVDRGSAVLAQSTLVHGVAGAALLAVVVGLAPLLARRGARRLLLVAGSGAAVLSLLQWGVGVLMTTGAVDHEATWSAALLRTVDRLDVVKLLLLAVTVVTAGAAATGLPRWWRRLSWATGALLVVGAAGLLVPAPLLTGVLALSLVSLLTWAGSLAVAGRPRTGGTARERRLPHRLRACAVASGTPVEEVVTTAPAVGRQIR
ncbi:MAG: CPBP family intramembrane glutamic endopeptidase [Candidatus Nanopelagicales bacterium]